MARRLAILALALLAASAPAPADVIHLKSGQKQPGLIVEDRADTPSVKIRTASGDIAIPRTKIERVEKESESMGHVRLGDQYTEAGKHADAAAEYRTAMQLDRDNREAGEKLRKSDSQASAARQTQNRQAIDKLEETVQDALSLARQKKFDQAQKTLKAADPGEGSPQYTTWRKATAQLYQMWGTDRADRQDLGGAAEKLQLALRLDPDNSTARAMLIRAWEGDPSKLNEMIEHYRQSTRPEDRMKMAEALFKLKRYEEALPLYIEYTQDPSRLDKVTEDRIRLMFDMLHRQYAEKGDFPKAMETYKAFLQFSPNEDLTPLARYEYMIRRSTTDMNDVDARAKLAQFAEERGMVETAKKEYLNILQIDPKNATATAGVRRFADTDLADLREFFNAQQYLLATQKAVEVEKAYTMFPEVVEQARAISAKSEVEQQKQAKNRLEQGTLLAQRGDDYYNQGLAYLSSYVSKDVDTAKRVFSPKIEATKYFRLALYAWQQALVIDPSLGQPTSCDLYRKISDAYAKYSVLANPMPPPLPRRNTNRLKSSPNTPGSL